MGPETGAEITVATLAVDHRLTRVSALQVNRIMPASNLAERLSNSLVKRSFLSAADLKSLWLFTPVTEQLILKIEEM